MTHTTPLNVQRGSGEKTQEKLNEPERYEFERQNGWQHVKHARLETERERDSPTLQALTHLALDRPSLPALFPYRETPDRPVVAG